MKRIKTFGMHSWELSLTICLNVLTRLSWYPSQNCSNLLYDIGAQNSKAWIQGIHSYQLPIYYTWVERDNCGQNALSKGICSEWDSNLRPSDYEWRAWTTTPQRSHNLCNSWTLLIMNPIQRHDKSCQIYSCVKDCGLCNKYISTVKHLGCLTQKKLESILII